MRKPNWKRRGVTRENAIQKQRAVDFANAELSRRGRIRRKEIEAMKNRKVFHG
jgi:hypothetical protein